MIRIITDSAADLTAQDLAQPGVYVVPMSITFEDGSSVEDDGRMTKDEFSSAWPPTASCRVPASPARRLLSKPLPMRNWPGTKPLSSPSARNFPARTSVP